LFPCICGLCG